MKVRDRALGRPGWYSRAGLSAVLACALLAVLAVLPLGAGTVQQARADADSKTVTGPRVWRPATGTYGPTGTVTVTPTSSLTDQVVHVSWTGFTPTTTIDGQPRTSVQVADSSAIYAVRVYECRGSDPGPTDCYGDPLYGGNPAAGFQQPNRGGGLSAPEFPSNMAIAATAPNGTGQADLEVFTAVQSQSLGCDDTHPCSIVVEPNYGGDALGIDALLNNDPSGAPNCGDHSYDRDGGTNQATDATVAGGGNLVNNNETGEACAWANHVVVPLSFAPTATSCKVAAADFTMAGLEMANRAVQQWRSGLCLATTDPLNIQYTFSGGEPQARSAFLRQSGADVALTALPDTSPAPRPYVYAPLANSAISVVFAVDNPVTGRPIHTMRLNARLLAKELTQSYAIEPAGSAPASVDGNPRCIFADPEFLALNPPSLIAPEQWPSCPNTPSSLPIVVGGTTDLVQQLTSWIAADPDAESFLQGAPDPWGMRIDPYYLRPAFSGYPVDSFVPQDSSGFHRIPNDPLSNWQQYEWNPLLGGLDQVARQFLSNTPTCQSPIMDGSGKHPACAAEVQGQRQLIAVLDTGEAEALGMPEAQLLNAAGSFVAPSLSSIEAAATDMPVSPQTGTQQLPYGVPDSAYARDAGAYPLTTVQYAMVPTAGQSAAKATAISQFVQQVTNPGGGQVYGRNPGQLALGYADLTQTQQAQAQAAVQHVAAQDGALPGNQTAPVSPSASPTATASTTTGPGGVQPLAAAPAPAIANPNGTGGAGQAGAPGLVPGGSGAAPEGDGKAAAGPSAAAAAETSSEPSLAPVAAGQPAPDRAGLARLLLPVVLIAGAVLLVGGPAVLLLSGTAAGGQLVARLRRTVGGG
ncbi:hypothetical protein ACIGXM_05350 [Kitasatospora sp. NPDC052896]|uniref:hypothetical protein n=1 Tax=Kitasatospora sp. NPDC052896 TaxID=3364061 RepID=UPI0037C86F78